MTSPTAGKSDPLVGRTPVANAPSPSPPALPKRFAQTVNPVVPLRRAAQTSLLPALRRIVESSLALPLNVQPIATSFPSASIPTAAGPVVNATLPKMRVNAGAPVAVNAPTQ